MTPNPYQCPEDPPTIKPNDEDPAWVAAVQESCNQLSKDYQEAKNAKDGMEAWERHEKRLERLGIK